MRGLLATVALSLFAASPALAAKIHLANTHPSCKGTVTVLVFNKDDKVRTVPSMSKKIKKGEQAKLKCNSSKRCSVSWNDKKGRKYDSAMVSAKKTSKKKPFILKCSSSKDR